MHHGPSTGHKIVNSDLVGCILKRTFNWRCSVLVLQETFGRLSHLDAQKCLGSLVVKCSRTELLAQEVFFADQSVNEAVHISPN